MSGPRPVPVPKEWVSAIDGWDAWMRMRGLTDQTRYGWKHKVVHFARAIHKSPKEVISADIIRFLSRGESRGTLRADHSALNSFFNFLLEFGKIEHNPMRYVPLAKRKIIKLPPAPENAVMKAEHTDARVCLMTLLMADMGLRRSEVAQIKTDDITNDGTQMTITIHGKGDKDRIIPVDDQVARLIKQLKPQRGWLFPSKDHSVYNGKHLTAARVGKIVSLATGWPCHSFRRKFATDVWQATGDVMMVKELLGHSNLNTTENYIWTTQSELRQAMRSLDDWKKKKHSPHLMDPIKVLEGYGLSFSAARDLVDQIRTC